MKMLKRFVPFLVLGLMLASACAQEGAAGGGGMNPYGQGGAPSSGAGAGSISSGAGSMGSGGSMSGGGAMR